MPGAAEPLQPQTAMEGTGETMKLQTPDAEGHAKSGADDEEYDPHDHRDLKKPTNDLETLVHLLKCSLGTGILAMPQAFARAGLITGILSTVVVGVIITHCLHVLVRSQYAACKLKRVPLLSYPAAMTVALDNGPGCFKKMAKPSAPVVDLFLVIYQLGICCVYIVFIASNIKNMVDPYKVLPMEVHMLIILGPLIIFNLIPSLKLLAPFSLLANILTMVALFIIFYFLLTLDKKVPDAMDLWGSPKTFPLFFGTILFALTAVGVVIALENNMKTPKSFGKPLGTLNVGMSFIVLLYCGIGSVGYVFCTSQCSDSITLDLPNTPLAVSVSIMFCIAIFISYGLHCYVPIEVVWRYVQPRLPESERAQNIALPILRVSLCLLTFVFAVAVPRLGLFISLFGALCLSALGICFPAIMDYSVHYPDAGKHSYRIWKNIILFLIGLIGLIAGTYTAIHSIIVSFSPPTASQ